MADYVIAGSGINALVAASLLAMKGRKVLVYFYPKADTPGCTQQTCLLRDLVDDIGRGEIALPDIPRQGRR